MGDFMKNSKIRMRDELKDYILSKRILKAWTGWFISLLISVLISYLLPYMGKLIVSNSLLKEIGIALMGLSAGMFGIVIAGFAIIITIDKDFILFIKKVDYKKGTQHLEDLMFPFWFASILWALLLIFSLLTYFSGNIKLNCFINKLLLCFLLLLFFISLYYTIQVVGNVYKLSIMKSEKYLIDNLKEDNNINK